VEQPTGKPVALKLTGTAQIDGQRVTRPARGADNTMQAFLWRHLVPVQEMMVLSPKFKWKVVPMPPVATVPIRIPVGGSQKVTVKGMRGGWLKDAILELDEPPSGLRLRDTSLEGTTLSFTLAVDEDVTESFAGNVIVAIIREFTPKAREGRPPPKKRRSRVGYLPAVPVEISVK